MLITKFIVEQRIIVIVYLDAMKTCTNKQILYEG